MKVIAIIYSRMGSSRFKSKPLKNINQFTLIDLVIDRIKKIKNIDQIVLATTSKNEDKILIEKAKSQKINYFCGSTNNLVKRTLDCLNQYKADYFIRICGDRPLFDLNLIKKSLKILYKNQDLDLISTEINSKSIPGLVTEIISKKSIEKISKEKLSILEKEHLVNYIYNNLYKFNIFNINSTFKKNGMSLTIDYKNDIEKISYILDKNYPTGYLDTLKNLKIAKEWYSKINNEK